MKRIDQTETNKNYIENTSPTIPSSLPPIILSGGQRISYRGQEQERKAILAGQMLNSWHSHSDHDNTISTQIERERLLELTKCLQQRLAASTDKLMKLEIEVGTLCKQNAHLEKIIRSRSAAVFFSRNVILGGGEVVVMGGNIVTDQ